MPIPAQFEGRLALPVVAAPMFLVSGPELLLACCRHGVLGTLPALNQRTSDGFEEWLIHIKEALALHEDSTGRLAAPYGINLIVHPTNPRLRADLELCVKYQVPLVITSLGAATEVVDAVHSYGGVVFHDVTNLKHAKKAAAAGVDGLIAVSAGAGGHAGTTNPLALLSEIRQFFDKTILLAGCLNNGRDIATALQMGADLAYMGTRFINTEESQASAAYKQMIQECVAADIIHTPAVSGVPASFMRPSLEKAGYEMAALQQPGNINYGEKLKPVDDEAKAWKTVWSAGQGCGSINDVVAAGELIERLGLELAESFTTQLHQARRWLK